MGFQKVIQKIILQNLHIMHPTNILILLSN